MEFNLLGRNKAINANADWSRDHNICYSSYATLSVMENSDDDWETQGLGSTALILSHGDAIALSLSASGHIHAREGNLTL